MNGDARKREFESEGNAARPGLLRELWAFMTTNKKWWLGPIILVLLLMGALMALSTSVAAPFVYTMF